MSLLTKIPISKASSPIDYGSRLLLLGSCFSENIGAKLTYYKFQNLQNPFGILFHPLAIERLIHNAVQQIVYGEDDVFKASERWHCFNAHSILSNPSKEEIIADLNEHSNQTYIQLKNTNYIIITLGTAWVYRKKSDGQVVANCHKVPQINFTKELLGVDTVVGSLQRIISLVRSLNNKVQFIFTVSPVRHLKDGFVENQLSKAHLISAIHEVLKLDNTSYFPSYELMMDELRDYRFYGTDMIHPNETAIDYIWEKFREVWIDVKVDETMKMVHEIQQGLRHRAFDPNGLAHQKFLRSLEGKIAYIKKEYPFMDFNSTKS
jgi:hypothetical protein